MKKKSVLGMLVVTAALGVFMNIHHPVTPTLFTEMGLPSRIFGTSYAAMCFFSFLTSPFWGEISDAKGRLNVFLISCIGYGLAQLSLGFCTTEATVLISRSAAGFFASGTSIASIAYVADLSSPRQRGRAMSVVIAVQSVSLAVGYLLGGVLGSLSFVLAFTVQGIGMIGLGVATVALLEESLTETRQIERGTLLRNINPLSSFLNARHLLSGAMILFAGVVIFSSFASTCYDNAFNYYLKDQMNFIPAYNGILKAIIGIIGLAANFTINMWIVERTRVRLSMAVVLLLCCLSSAGALISTDLLPLFLGMNLAFYTVNAIYQPIIQTLSYQRRGKTEIGMVTGLVNALKSLGNVAGSLFAGLIYDVSFILPFAAASVLFGAASLTGYLYYRADHTEEK